MKKQNTNPVINRDLDDWLKNQKTIDLGNYPTVKIYR